MISSYGATDLIRDNQNARCSGGLNDLKYNFANHRVETILLCTLTVIIPGAIIILVVLSIRSCLNVNKPLRSRFQGLLEREYGGHKIKFNPHTMIFKPNQVATPECPIGVRFVKKGLADRIENISSSSLVIGYYKGKKFVEEEFTKESEGMYKSSLDGRIYPLMEPEESISIRFRARAQIEAIPYLEDVRESLQKQRELLDNHDALKKKIGMAFRLLSSEVSECSETTPLLQCY